jgi:hypothetical protein
VCTCVRFDCRDVSFAQSPQPLALFISLILDIDCQGHFLDLHSLSGPFNIGESNYLSIRNGHFTNYAPQAAAQWSTKSVLEQYNVTRSVIGEAPNSTARMENLFMEHPCVVRPGAPLPICS